MLVGIFAGWNDKAYMLDIYYSRGEAKGKYSDPITIFYYIVLLLLYVAKGMWGLTIFWIINICLVVIAVGHSKDVVEEEIDNLENIS